MEFVVQVGLLVQVGKELVPPSMVRTILLTEDRRELAKISPVAPAHGLYLMSVGYDDKVLRPVPNAPKASFGRWLRYPVSISAWNRVVIRNITIMLLWRVMTLYISQDRPMPCTLHLGFLNFPCQCALDSLFTDDLQVLRTGLWPRWGSV